jgi:hypothetical protein
MNPVSRRTFIGSAVAGSVGLLTAGTLKCAGGATNTSIFTPRMAVNPAIDNLRVVCGVNPAMITGNPTGWEMEGQNRCITADQVERTMDAMACSLTGKNAAADAWATIFRKPETKSWEAVKVAIKVNCIAKNHPRVAVVNHVCTVLNRLGVVPGNTIIYDGCHNAAPFYGAYVGKGLPVGVVVSDKNSAMGGMMKISIPAPKAGSYNCSRVLADGTIDILVNIAVNKGHDQSLGKTTLTLKNHAGTFEPKVIHTGGGLDYILAFNKSNAIWGGTPVRQQLCIVDTLWGSVDGPFATPDKRLDRLVMGTFSGAVDYLTAKKIREPLMGAQHGSIERFVTEFGYEEKELGDLVTFTV